MEDIEDMAPQSLVGLHLPLPTVLPKPRTRSIKPLATAKENFPPTGVPGVQTIFLKTFGCAHNQSDSEYMAGQLSAYGYTISEEPDTADLWLINTCTVKSPSQSAMETLIHRGKSAKKPLVVAGCVPQGSKDLKDLDGVSIVGVQQIDRVVEVVEETLRGHEVRLLRRSSLPALDLPKVRKNKFVEILPINVGCLGACTYCKTKHARGHLGSYPVSALVERMKSVIADKVKEVWLSSEDTGAYGRDIQTNLPTLLHALVAELPKDGSVMLRIGMTNPPYILEHLEDIAEILCHPFVYSFLHVPVQSGSDTVLHAMKREYTVGEFKRVVDTLLKLVPGMQIATDVICGFPGETEDEFEETIKLIQEYKFPQVHISQFYPRPGTPAARMKRVPTGEVKKRSRKLTMLFESFSPYKDMEGMICRVWVTDIAADGIHLVGHTKSYVQVLLSTAEDLLGSCVNVRVISTGRWSVVGEVVRFETKPVTGNMHSDSENSESGLAMQHKTSERPAFSCVSEMLHCGEEGCCNQGAQNDVPLSRERSLLNGSHGTKLHANTSNDIGKIVTHTSMNGLVKRSISSTVPNRLPMTQAEVKGASEEKKDKEVAWLQGKWHALDWFLIAFLLLSLSSFLILLFKILNLV